MSIHHLKETHLRKPTTGLASNEVHELLIELEEVKVHQRFLDEMGLPIEGARCTLYEEGSDEPLDVGTTDANGEVCFEKLNKKIFNLQVEMEGWSEPLIQGAPYLRSDVAEPHLQHLRPPLPDEHSEQIQCPVWKMNPRIVTFPAVES